MILQDLFVLHCVFLPRINRALDSFASAWNQHPLRTERMWSPRKIWMNGMRRAQCEGAHDVVDNTPADLEQFGVEPVGALPEPEQQVTVSKTVCPLSIAARQQFLTTISCFGTSAEDDYGIRVFCTARAYLRELLQDSSNSSSD